MSKRRLFRTGNFELTRTHHHWVSDFEIAEETGRMGPGHRALHQ